MNKQNPKEGFVKNAEPAPAEITQESFEPNYGPPVTEEPPRDEWPVTVRLLHKAVRDMKGNMVKELTFREPTGGDINRVGNPCHVDQMGDVIILDRKMIVMMAQLSGIVQPFLENMDPRDYNSCAYRLRGFFIPNPEAW